jgi:tetratricopeptide (TPR) repeat protein
MSVMNDHPPRETLEAFLRGAVSSWETREVIAHLLAGCPACRKAIEPLVAAMFQPSAARSAPADEAPYEEPVAAALAAVRRRSAALERERAEARVKLARLLFGGRRAGDPPAGDEPGFWTWGLCETLLDTSWDLRESDPAGMLYLAELAVEGTERLDATACGIAPLADLRAQAWANLANACRVSDRLALAETAMVRAFEARKQGTGAPLLRARLAELSASLLCDQRQFPAAFRLLDLACDLYRRHGDAHDAGRALIKKGLHTGYTGDPEEGIHLIARGLRRVERERDPRLVFQALHNILLFRVELGDFRAARRQLWEMRPLYVQHADRIALVKLRWIEGKIFVGLCDLARAEAALRQAKEEFEAEGLIYDGALISFDLAAVWLRLGRTADVHRLASEMLDTFRTRYIAREALASLLMLRDAAGRNEATLDLIELVASVFERAEPDKRLFPIGARS